MGRSALVAAGIAVAGIAPSARAEVPPPADFFPIGSFLQPTYNFAQWKARGVNTMVDFNVGANSQQQWESAVIANGFFEIRAPSANPADDINNKHLLAWSHTDEPDVNNVPAATLQATYDKLKKIDPKMPVYVNFSGGDVLYPGSGYSHADYQKFAKAADWIGNDIYPITGYGRPDFVDLAQTGPWNPGPTRWNGGTVMDTLRPLTGKPQYAYVETSAQGLNVPNSRGPTPEEVRGEIWDDIIHGARGIVYFGFGFSPWSQDATTPAVSAELTKQDALIASLGGVINSGSLTDAQRVTLTNPTLEGTWRVLNGVKYFIVLNFSHTALTNASVTLPGTTAGESLQVFNESRSELLNNSGILTDSFGAYQTHIYQLGANGQLASAAPGSSVPEPAMGSLVLLATGMLTFRPRRARR